MSILKGQNIFFEKKIKLSAQTEEMFHPNDVDLVLDIVPDESGRVVCEYYLAYHPTRVIFWLESVTPSQSLVFKMKVSFKHMWWKANIGTTECCIPALHVQAKIFLRSSMTRFVMVFGSLISPMSTTAYAPDELRTMLEVLPTEVTELANVPGRRRIMFILLKHFAEEKLANFHGEPSVRLNRGTTLNILLFYAPGRHLRTIEYLTCDGMISRRTWKEFSAGVQNIISSLLLQSKNDEMIGVSYSEACQMIQGFRDTSGTFENMAVAHSLPYGCLYWG
ncbi:hypothetical protein EDD85DRAFT_798793 [Armillaria nabsnona]|nr:hypothetical protein EDD85DRAFT_798793 [Armillaria nabsnona]